MVLFGQLCVCVSQRVVGFNLVVASKWSGHQKPSISAGIKHISLTAIIHRVTGGGPGSDRHPGGNPFTHTCTYSNHTHTHTHTDSPSGWWPWASCCVIINIIVAIFWYFQRMIKNWSDQLGNFFSFALFCVTFRQALELHFCFAKVFKRQCLFTFPGNTSVCQAVGLENVYLYHDKSH